MKNFNLIILIFLVSACKNENTPVAEDPDSGSTFENFDWLLGNWQRSNEKEDRETVEIWNKKNANEYKGLGFTLQNKDTIWKEEIRLIKSDSSWNFEATGEGETNSTIFKLSRIDNERFIAENEENEFPKVIEYYKNGNNLHALIAGGGREILFEFENIRK